MYNETTRLVKVVMPVDTEEGILQGETNPILASVNPTRTAGDSGAIMLSDTAENLFIAYEVVAMVKDDSTGKTHFSQLKWKRLGTVEDEDGGEAKSVADPSGDGDGEPIVAKGAMRDGSDTSDDDTSDDEPQLVYQFMFESGDLFVAAAADEYPALDGDELQMLSDDSSSGGGSPLIVRCTVSNDEYVLSEDWDTINEAFTEDGRPVLIELLNTGTKSSSTCTYCLVTEVHSIETASEATSSSGNGYVVVCTNLSNVDFNFKYIFYSDTSSGTLSCSEALPIGGSTGGGVLVVHETVTEEGLSTTRTLDTTYADIAAAGFCVLDSEEEEGMHKFSTVSERGFDNEYYVSFSYNSHAYYATDSENGYPVNTRQK